MVGGYLITSLVATPCTSRKYLIYTITKNRMQHVWAILTAPEGCGATVCGEIIKRAGAGHEGYTD